MLYKSMYGPATFNAAARCKAAAGLLQGKQQASKHIWHTGTARQGKQGNDGLLEAAAAGIYKRIIIHVH